MASASAYGPVIRNAVSIFLIKLFPALANVIVLVLYSRALPADDYGHYQNFWVRLLVISAIVGLGLPVTILTYSPVVIRSYAKQLKRRQYVLFVGLLLIGSGVFAFMERQTIDMPVLLSAAVLCLYTLYGIQESLLVVVKKFSVLAISNLLFAVWFIAVHVWVVRNGFDIDQIFLLVVAGMSMRFLILAAVTNTSFQKIGIERFTAEARQEIRKLWWHLGFYDVLLVVFRWIDKFIISLVLSAELSGIYFNGSQDIPFLPLLLGAVGSSVLVQLAQNKTGSKEHSYILLHQSARMLSCIVFPLFFFLLFFSEAVIVTVFSEKFLASVPIFIVAIMVLPLRAYNYTVLLQHLHRGDIINKGAVMDLLLACALMYPLYKWLGLPGMALSFIISTYLQVAYYLWMTSLLLKVPVRRLLPLGNWLLKFLLFGCVMFLLHYVVITQVGHRTAVLIGLVALVIVSAVTFFIEWKAMPKTKIANG